MRSLAGKEHKKLTAEVALVAGLNSDELRTRWKAIYGIEVPSRLGRDLLMRAVAYGMQKRLLGDVKPATRRLLERVARDAHARQPIRVTLTTELVPGTVLLREWSGIKHQVTVLENGLMFRGKRWRSLSEIAREITGSRWSGPLFFGLRGQVKQVSNGK